MRKIIEIVEDVYEWNRNNKKGYFTEISYINHTGDSQIYTQSFLDNMYESLLYIMGQARKNTHQEHYAINTEYIFDSGWNGKTREQSDEKNIVVHGLYSDYYFNGSPQVDLYGLNSNVDEKGVKIQANTESILIYLNNAPTISHQTGLKNPKSYYDQYNLVDFSSVIDGSFFDPSLVFIESAKEIEDWFSAYDLILTELLSSSNSYFSIGGTSGYVPQVELPFESIYTSPPKTSDLYKINSKYTLSSWYDDLTGESGEFVRQSGHYKHTATNINEINTFNVYSEEITVNVDGEDGYTQITYPTSENGVTFGDSFDTIFNTAKSTFGDTYTLSAYQGVVSYQSEQNSSEILGAEYISGYLTRNGDGTNVIITGEIVEQYKEMLEAGKGSDYTVESVYQILTNSENRWDDIIAVIDSSTKKPSDTLLRLCDRNDEFEYVFTLPNNDVNGAWSAEIIGYSLPDFDIGSEYTIYKLEDPEPTP